MFDKKDAKLGDSFFNTKDTKWYYYDGLNWVLPLIFSYRNYRGQTSERSVIPVSVYFGVTDFYKTPCWLMHSFDVEKKQYRDFRMEDIVCDRSVNVERKEKCSVDGLMILRVVIL